LSNVLSFSILLTDTARISFGDRKVNSTLSTSEETGCAIFMTAKVRFQEAKAGAVLFIASMTPGRAHGLADVVSCAAENRF
jgi:hypothetical protein